jgi:hypothetical protein
MTLGELVLTALVDKRAILNDEDLLRRVFMAGARVPATFDDVHRERLFQIEIQRIRETGAER